MIDAPPSWIGRRSSREDPLGGGDRLVVVADLAEEDRELVAALAGDDVIGPDRAGEPLGDLDEDLVADGVAVGVVDALEVVEVDEEQGDRAGTAAVAGERPLEVVAEEDAVGEPGQRVVQGVVDELRLEPLPVGRVDQQALRDGPAALAVVGDRVSLVAYPDLGAVAGDHPVLGPEGLAGPPVLLVGGEAAPRSSGWIRLGQSSGIVTSSSGR